LSLPLQKENALGVPGAQEWVNDLPNEENKRFTTPARGNAERILLLQRQRQFVDGEGGVERDLRLDPAWAY